MTAAEELAINKRQGSIGILFAVVAVITVTVVVGVIYITDQLKKLADYKITFLRWRKNSITATKIDATLTFEITNTSNVDASVDGYSFDVIVNGKKVSTVTSNDMITLNAKGTSDIDVNVVFNPLQVSQTALANLGDLISGQQNIKIDIKGNLIGIKSSIIKIKEFPVTYSTTLKDLLA